MRIGGKVNGGILRTLCGISCFFANGFAEVSVCLVMVCVLLAQ